MPNNKLYAWDGVSLASTLAQTPVADLSADGDVYADTAPLYNAQPGYPRMVVRPRLSWRPSTTPAR